MDKDTSVQRRSPQRSVLDYILLKEEMMQKSLKSVHVDEEKIFCPYSGRRVVGILILVDVKYTVWSESETALSICIKFHRYVLIMGSCF